MCLGLAAGAASAREPAGSWNLGASSRLTPAMSLEALYDSNLYRTHADAAGSMAWVGKPSLAFESTAVEAVTFNLDYAAALGRFRRDGDDDYFDQSLRMGGAFVGPLITARAELARKRAHDARGTGPSNGAPASAFETGPFVEPTEFSLTSAKAALGVGAEEARWRLDLDIEHRVKSYLNLETITRQRNYATTLELAHLFVNLKERLDLMFEGGFQQVGYDNAQTSGTLAGTKLDSDLNRLLIGLSWKGRDGGKGKFAFGGESRSFNQLGDRNRFVWDLEIRWVLSPATQMLLASQRRSRETDNEGDSIDDSSYDVGVELQISKRLGVETGIGYLVEEFEDSTPAREDDIFNARAALNYDFGRFVTWQLGIRYSNRDGSVPDTNFDRTQLYLRAELGL